MSWIISSKNEIKCEIDKSNHQDWLNKYSWYNTSICFKLNGSMFEDYARTGRYNLMCSLVAHDKIQPAYEDDESSIGDRSVPKNAKTKALKALGATLNFINIWLKLLEENYCTGCVAYRTDMKYMLNQMPLTIIKALTPKQKVQKLMTEIGGG